MPQWGMFKKLDLSRTEDKLKAFILVSGLALVIFLAAAGALKVTGSSQFCTRCHVMAPEYVTWKASSHLQVACTDCHVRSGYGNLIVHKLSLFKEIYLYSTGLYSRPIKMSQPLADETCTKCHSMNRDFTPSGDLIIPHDKHAARKVLCVECHNGVAHGNIVGRKMTSEGEYSVWTEEFGKQQMTKDYTEPKMNTCLECHIKRNVTQACEACHTQISMPPDHKVKDFGKTHGHLARVDLGYCNKCHSYSLEAKDIPSDDPVTRYARGNVFCYECHQKTPAGHVEGWKMVHKRDVKNGNVAGCLVCHNNEKASPQDKAVPTYCAKCHGKQTGSSAKDPDKPDKPDNNNVEKKPGVVTFQKQHQAGWRKYHPTVVKEKGASNEGCWNCHETTHCSACHTNRL